MIKIIDYREDNKWCVYIHTSPSGKYYVGITGQTHPSKRWRKGLAYNENPHFNNAIIKYGWDKITHEIIVSKLTKEEACKMEVLLIKSLKSYESNLGYNLSLGGDSTSIFTPTDATRKKMSENHADFTGGNSPKSKKVICLNDLKVYDSLTEAGKWCNKKARDIYFCCNGKQKSAGKHPITGVPVQWSYYDENVEYKIKVYAPETKEIRVICITTGEIFDSILKASIHYNLKSSGRISMCCKNKVSYYGIASASNEKLRWMYYDDYQKLNTINL